MLSWRIEWGISYNLFREWELNVFCLLPEVSVTQTVLGNANPIGAGGAWRSSKKVTPGEHAASRAHAAFRSRPFQEIDLNILVFNYTVFSPAHPVCLRDPEEQSAAMQHGAFSPYAAGPA